MANEGDEAGGTGTLGKAMAVLETVALAERPMRFTEVLAVSGQPRGTLHRQLSHLVQEGLLELRPDHAYVPGLRLLKLASASWARNEFRAVAAPFLEIHEQDARALGIRNGQPVRVRSCRGTVELPARTSKSIRPGTVFAPFHWGSLWNERSVANLATSETVDPRSKEPELKFAAVCVEAV